MKMTAKKVIAAIAALTLSYGAIPSGLGNAPLFSSILTARAEENPNAYIENNTLYLSGDLTRNEITAFRNDSSFDYVVATGAKFPQNCYELFTGFECSKMDLSGADFSGTTRLEAMFKNCRSLESLKIDLSGAGGVKDMSHMFEYCENLEEIEFTGADTSGATDMSYMFRNCGKLEAIDLENFDTSNVYNFTSMFMNCYSLEELDVSDFDTSSAQDMKWMFSNCAGLTELDVSNFDTSGVRKMENMFASCRSLTALDLSSFDTSNVTTMYGMFSSCENLAAVDLSSFNTSKVTSMSMMFHWCKKLASIDVSGFETSKVTNFDGMFCFCESLTTLDVTNFDTSNAEYIGSMFGSCKKLDSIDVSKFDTSNVINMYGMFSDCASLTKLDLSNFDTSSNTTMNRMFNGCESLRSLDLKNFDTSNVTDLHATFMDCKSLESLDISSFDTSKVIDMSSMFSGCTALTSLDLRSFDTSNVIDMRSMFSDCTQLKKLDVTCFDTSYVNKNYDYQSDILKDCTAYNVTYTDAGLTLDHGRIGLRLFFTTNADLRTVVMNGPAGEKKADISELTAYASGKYSVNYYVNALMANEPVSFSFYDADGRKINLLNSSREIVSKSSKSYSVRDYVTDSLEYISSDKEKALVSALDNYCKAAENYFNGTQNEIEGIDSVKNSDLDNAKPTLKDGVKISLLLGSASSVRIYTDSDNVFIDDNSEKAVAHTGNYGKYYEISDITAQDLSNSHKITIDGKDYYFSPLSYCYRVLNRYNKNGEELSTDKANLVSLSKAFYIYANAAKAYIS